MPANYCKCGSPNELDANFCKRCGKSMKIGVAKATDTSAYPLEPEEDEIPARLRPKRRVPMPIPAISPPLVTEADGSMSIELPEDTDEEGDGVSLNFVPEVKRLEIESIQTIEVKGVSFASLVAEAERAKAQQH